jgi:hypothetical protein
VDQNVKLLINGRFLPEKELHCLEGSPWYEFYAGMKVRSVSDQAYKALEDLRGVMCPLKENSTSEIVDISPRLAFDKSYSQVRPRSWCAFPYTPLSLTVNDSSSIGVWNPCIPPHVMFLG